MVIYLRNFETFTGTQLMKIMAIWLIPKIQSNKQKLNVINELTSILGSFNPIQHYLWHYYNKCLVLILYRVKFCMFKISNEESRQEQSTQHCRRVDGAHKPFSSRGTISRRQPRCGEHFFRGGVSMAHGGLPML